MQNNPDDPETIAQGVIQMYTKGTTSAYQAMRDYYDLSHVVEARNIYLYPYKNHKNDQISINEGIVRKNTAT